jgi:hypothetical protein
MSDSLEELGKELAKQRKTEEEFICDICGLVYDSEEELEEHYFRNHKEQLEILEDKIEELSENKEVKEGIEAYKENLKRQILLEANPREVKAYSENPSMLEERVQKHLLLSALKEKTDSANEGQLLVAIKTRAKEELEQALSNKYCKICNDFYPCGLRKHLEEQASLGSKEHEEYLRYLDIMTTEDMERIKSYYEQYPKYEYYPKYAEVSEFAKSSEKLSKESEEKKKAVFILESLLRKRRKD